MPIQEIEDIVRHIVEEVYPVRIYLFGSFANGTYRDESDLDFYIVVADDGQNLTDLTVRAYRAIRHVRKHAVDILIGTQADFEARKSVPSIENEVYHKGVLLYGE